MSRFLAAVILAVSVAISGCASMGGTSSAASNTFASDALFTQVTKGLDMTSTQAAGSLGGLVSLAKSRLSPADYSKFTGLLPSGDKYLKFAQENGLVKKPVENVAGLNDVFADLDVKPETARSFLGGMSQWVTNKGGDAGRNLFASVLSK